MLVSRSLHLMTAFDVAPDVMLAIGGVIGIAVLVGIAAAVGVVLLVIKRSLVNTCPVGLSFHATVLDSYAALDRESLERHTRSFEHLGFAALAELVRMIEFETSARPEPCGSAGSWYDDERRNAVSVRETLAGRSIAVMLREFFSYRGRTEWLGSLKPARSNARNDYN